MEEAAFSPACPNCAKLRKRVAELEGQVAKLQAKLAELEARLHRSSSNAAAVG
jgi:phage shock protein A